MKLSVLKPGSKTRISLGFCCGSPWTYSSWSEGGDGVFLKKAPAEPGTDHADESLPENRQ